MRKRIAIAGLVVITGACDVVEPDTSSSLRNAELSYGSPHYYLHEGRPVPLHPDYSRAVIVMADDRLVTDVTTPVLAARGISVREARAIRQRPDHYVIHLAGPETNAAAAIEDLRAAAGVAFIAPAYTLEMGRDTLILINEVVVRFRSTASESEIDELVADFGASIIRRPVSEYGWREYRLSYPGSAEPLAFALALAEHPLVEWAEPNKIGTRYPALQTPTDPYYGLQYYFNNSAYPAVDINIEGVWNLTLGEGTPSAGGVWVAVIDDGVDANHPDFAGQVVSSFAYDAVIADHSRASSPLCSSDSHGTNVAGMILSQHSNSEGTAGGAPAVNLVPIRIYSQCDGIATDADIADAITWAWYWTESDVLNNSWAMSHQSQAVTTAINSAVANGRNGAGATVVFAAGNTSNRALGSYVGMSYPGYLASVIGVGAIDRYGASANYNPRDSRMDIVAPSGATAKLNTCDTNGDVVTPELSGSKGCNDGPSSDVDYTSHFTGTSAAAPQVSLAAALLYSDDPALTEAQVRGLLINNATYWGRSDDYGAGLLNVGRAFAPPVQASIDGPTSVPSGRLCSWTAIVSGGRAPYEYNWYRNGLLVSTNSMYSANTGSTDFDLSLVVTDVMNTSASVDEFIDVGAGSRC